MKHHAIEVPGVVSSPPYDEYGMFSGPMLSLRYPLEMGRRWQLWLGTLNPRERQRKLKAMKRLIKVAAK